MKLDFAVICENSFTDASGKLNIIQAFDLINALSFPATHPKMVVVTKFSRENQDKNNDFKYTISIANKDNNVEIAKAEGRLSSTKNNIQMITEFVGLTFEKSATYNIKINFDGIDYKIIELPVIKIPSTKE